MLACGGSVWAVFGGLAHVKSAGKKRGVKMVVKREGMVEGAAFLSTKWTLKRGEPLPTWDWCIQRAETLASRTSVTSKNGRHAIDGICFFGLCLSWGGWVGPPTNPPPTLLACRDGYYWGCVGLGRDLRLSLHVSDLAQGWV